MAIRRSVTLSSALLMTLALGAPVLAQRAPAKPAAEELDPTTARLQALNTEARAAFDAYSYRSAEEKLQQALTLALEAHLKPNPTLARTNLLMGVTCVSGFNDLYRGLHYFVQALREDSGVTVPKELATPQLGQMFGKAREAVKAIGNPPTIDLGAATLEKTEGGRSAEAKPTALGLVHVPIDSAKRGYPIPVKAQAGIDVQAQRVYLFFRPAGKVEFTQLQMKKTQGTFYGAIPPSATAVGRYVHYYIEARDQRGRLAASNGSARSPNVIILR